MNAVLTACVIVVLICAVSVGLTVVEFRKIPPLTFQCRRCTALFHQAAHRAYPRGCPRCGARDWAE